MLTRRIIIPAFCGFLLSFAAHCQDAEIGDLPAGVRFQNAYEVLLQADVARDEDRPAEAASLYEAARDMHARLLEECPEWQPRVVAFRAAYCNDQLAFVLMSRDPDTGAAIVVPEEGNSATQPSAPAPATPEVKATVRDMIREGRTNEARELLLETLQTHPDSRVVRALLAAAQCRAGNFDDAVHVLQELTKEYPDDTTARMILSTAYFGQGRYAEALAELEQVMQMEPSLSEAHFNAIQIYLRASPPDIGAAREHYQIFLELGGNADSDVEKSLEQTEGPQPDVPASVDSEGEDEDQNSESTTEAAADAAVPVGP